MQHQISRLARITTKVAGFWLATFVAFASQAAAQPIVTWVAGANGKSPTHVAVSGLSDAQLKTLAAAQWDATRWQRLLSVHVGEQGKPGDVPMLGSYRVDGGTVRFDPQFPLDPGQAYRAVFRQAELPANAARVEELTVVHKPPAHSADPTTVVAQIYPSAETVPENLLKFYVHFSAPMSGGRIYDHIHLRNEAGKDIELPFLEIHEELWDPTMTRLTLFIDPGRIKRGVKPLEDVGAALEAGKRFALVIDKEWKDAAGNPLKQPFEKQFAAGPADRTPPDPARWKIQAARPGTKEPLSIDFGESMDHALALRLVSIHDRTGKAVQGTPALKDAERTWQFTPAAAWSAGEYQLIVTTTIEDLAGNNIGKAFDVEVDGAAPRELVRKTVSLPVQIR